MVVLPFVDTVRRVQDMTKALECRDSEFPRCDLLIRDEGPMILWEGGDALPDRFVFLFKEGVLKIMCGRSVLADLGNVPSECLRTVAAASRMVVMQIGTDRQVSVKVGNIIHA